MSVGKKACGEDVAMRAVNRCLCLIWNNERNWLCRASESFEVQKERLALRICCAQAQGGCVKFGRLTVTEN